MQKYLKNSVAGIIAILMILLTGCTKSQDNMQVSMLNQPDIELTNPSINSEKETDTGVLKVDHECKIDDFNTEGTSPTNISLDVAHQYFKNTSDGVKILEFNPRFASGCLWVTAHSARVATSIDEMNLPLDGFSYEACLYKNDENKWEKGDQPEWIKADGNFQEGVYLVLIDITVENDGASIKVDPDKQGGFLGDPYLFNMDGIFSLFDFNRESGYLTIDYFSGISGEPEYDPDFELLFRLEPGASKSYTIGFVVEENWLSDSADLSQLYIGNTMGLPEGVYINIGLRKNSI